MPHHMAAELKRMILCGEDGDCDAACQIVTMSHDFDLFPTLVKAAEDRHHRRIHAVLSAIQHLADALHRDLVRHLAHVDTQHRDPAFVRRNVLTALEAGLANYATHGRHELIHAYLLLAPSDHAELLRMLHDGKHACHSPTVDLLRESDAPGLIKKCVELLRNVDVPKAALEAIGLRGDREFVRCLLSQLRHPVPLRVIYNMKRLQSVAWFEQPSELLEADGRSQAVAIELAAASNTSESSLFALLSLLLRCGLAEGRRASCTALAKFRSAETDALVRRALDDPDAGVQAAAVRQLRQRGFPDALKLLVSLLDSRSIEVRDAARSSLAEFNFVRYRAMFDLLDEKAVHTTGVLVHKVDDAARGGLLQELSSPSLSARLRGIEMAVAMEATDDVCDELIELARSDNATVRQEAVAALGSCNRPRVLDALHLAAEDSSRSVREAAFASLERLAAGQDQSSEAVSLTIE
jgi:HEAT repeat protein